MSKKIGIYSLLAFIASIIIGIVCPQFCQDVAFIGTIYVNVLKCMIVPVLFTGIAYAIMGSSIGKGKLTLKTIVLFTCMFTISFLICSGLWTLLKPGVGMNFEEIVWEGELANVTVSDFFISLFPSNIFTAMSSNAMFQVILFAFVFGIAGAKVGTPALINGIGSLNRVFNQMLGYVMYLTPLGVFSLMGNTVATYGSQVIGVAGIYVGCAYLGCLVITLLVMILPVWIYAKINPIEYIKRVYKVWIMTLTTCSSAATLPTTIRVCNEDFGVPAVVTDIVVPLGCTIHMCGGAVSFSLLAFFSMQMLGMSMGIGTFILMLVLAIIINMAAPGIPGGGIVIGATYLTLLGIPITFIGFYAGIYRLLDMAYTTMNVCGDITANILIHKSVIDKLEETYQTYTRHSH